MISESNKFQHSRRYTNASAAQAAEDFLREEVTEAAATFDYLEYGIETQDDPTIDARAHKLGATIWKSFSKPDTSNQD